MNISFSTKAWEEYLSWQTLNKRMLKRINELLKDVARENPYEGIGKPEALKGNFSGFWSRRIDEKNRLVYRMINDDCQIIQCRGHYDDD